MSSESVSSLTPPSRPTRRRVSRWLSASMPLVGSTLVFTAPFLPWVSVAYYQTTNNQILYDKPTHTVYFIPAQIFAQEITSDTHLFGAPTSSTLGGGFFYWGLPILLLALVIGALLVRRPIAWRFTAGISIILVLVGILITLYLIPLSLSFGTDTCCHMNTKIEYGGFVALLGYGVCAVGILLSFVSRRSQH